MRSCLRVGQVTYSVGVRGIACLRVRRNLDNGESSVVAVVVLMVGADIAREVAHLWQQSVVPVTVIAVLATHGERAREHIHHRHAHQMRHKLLLRAAGTGRLSLEHGRSVSIRSKLRELRITVRIRNGPSRESSAHTGGPREVRRHIHSRRHSLVRSTNASATIRSEWQ